jgi:copper chaperone
MSFTFKVPSIKCDGCADIIEKEIKVHDAGANVKINVESQTVEVESTMSESSVKQAISISGHTVAD